MIFVDRLLNMIKMKLLCYKFDIIVQILCTCNIRNKGHDFII